MSVTQVAVDVACHADIRWFPSQKHYTVFIQKELL
jgi:hypothetical protein